MPEEIDGLEEEALGDALAATGAFAGSGVGGGLGDGGAQGGPSRRNAPSASRRREYVPVSQAGI